ncbi:TonB-dependent receptor [Aequorivita sp. KMM 9714]|uniref:TonB-dependent receptor n=1 Tax=Aequorivita sp. KMM 9714 TaxID=2707173 RepID=UPI0013EB2208|nr:TonB-dependent receptor [Aequorivita sp. KMM 9714]NGX84666.1 TonB-dependent receptor [Aequorivita sp. KMM 9714]
MRYIFTLILLIGCAINVFGQTITIKEEESNEPIELVTLSNVKLNLYTTTNAKGQADISAFKNIEKIEIRTLGYKSVTKSYAELESENFEIYLEISNFNLDEVVISGSRWRQSSDDVASKIISISAKEVALQNPQTAADLLGTSGKVFVQKSQQGGGSPIIRGFATSRLLYSIDGVRMNTAIFRSGNLQNVISLDPFAIENTEVLFGPGSVIYGSDAIGGVMSFQTLTPKFTFTDKPYITGKTSARYSSANNEKTGHLDVNLGFKNWAFITSFTSWDYDHLRQGRHGPDDYIKDFYVQRQGDSDIIIKQDDELLQIPSAYSQVNLMQKIRFKPNDKWDFQYGFHYSETSPYGRYDRHNRLKDGVPRYAEWDYGPQIWMMNTLNINHTANNPVFNQMSIRLAHQWFEESRLSRNFNKTSRSNQEEEVSAYSVNLDFVKSTSDNNTFFYGVEYVIDDVNSKGETKDIITDITEAAPSRYPVSTWQSLAVYFTDEYKASEDFTLSAGARYNHILLDSDFDTSFYSFPFSKASISKGALTGSIGGVYRPTKTLVLSTNLGTAFRAPNVDDIGKVFDSEPGSVVIPNPDLKPEYAYNADLGIAKVFGDIVKLDVTAYYTSLKNALVRRDFKLNGRDSIIYEGELSQVQAIQNAAVAHVYGVQAGVELKLPKGFGFSTDVNFQKGEEELDNGKTSPARHSSPFFGVSRLNYKKNKLRMELNVNYQGKRDFDDLPEGEKGKTEIYALDENGNPYAPSWYTLNYKAHYKLSNTFDISGGVENITDQRYRSYSSGISGAGRNFILSLTAHF